MKLARLLAGFVVFVMVFAMSPLAVMAAEESINGDPPPEHVLVWDSWELDGDGNITNPGFEGEWEYGYDAFDSIQDGIDAVAEGGIVNVFPGIYEEGGSFPSKYRSAGRNQNFSLWIWKPLTLQGVDPDTLLRFEGFDLRELPDLPVIVGTKQAHLGANVFVEADDVTITGLEIQPRGSEYGPYDYTDDKHVTVVNKAIEVIADNFRLEWCFINTYQGGQGPEIYVAWSTFAVSLVEPEAETAWIQNNVLFGGVRVNNGAGQGLVTISGNIIYNYHPAVSAIGLWGNDSQVPGQNASSGTPLVYENYIVVSNETPWAGTPRAVGAGDDDLAEMPDGDWLMEVLEQNYFTSAFVILTDVDPIEVKITATDSGFNILRAYGSYATAAAVAEEGDTIVPFYFDATAEEGFNFDSALMADGVQLAIPGADGGIVVFLPKDSLPGDGEYTVTIIPGAAPADPPVGYLLVGGADFTLLLDDVVITEFEDEIVMWFHPPAGMDLDKLAIFWYDPVAEEWVELEVTVDAANNRLIVTVDHWSYFALMDTDETPETGTGIMWLLPLGLLALAGGLLMRRRAVA